MSIRESFLGEGERVICWGVWRKSNPAGCDESGRMLGVMVQCWALCLYS